MKNRLLIGSKVRSLSRACLEVLTNSSSPLIAGVAIMVAVVIVVCVGSLNDWQKEKQFRKLNDKKEDRTVKVIRDGSEKVINVKVCGSLLVPHAIVC